MDDAQMSQHYEPCYQEYCPRLNWKVPLLLYGLTWLTTSGLQLDNFPLFFEVLVSLFLLPFNTDFFSDTLSLLMQFLSQSVQYSLSLMLILTCHEFGHYIQSCRYGVRSSLPYFIPLPFGPFGTLGAVIRMDSRIPHTRALFDIGISGPIAGLIPTMFCLYYGLSWSHIGPTSSSTGYQFGEPLLLQYMIYWFYGPLPPDTILYLHPVCKAGWVGLFITSLNLLPFSQLDGGHVFYALLGRRAAAFSWAVYYAIIIFIVVYQLWNWILLLILLAIFGISHPPTADDTMPLTPFRRVLGWTMLLFVLIGLTSNPISFNEPKQDGKDNRMYCYVSADNFPQSHDCGSDAD
ncbi:MAG: site-2 protease family protein [Planctomycetaceae bacterium]|nr:site-2 protease family protein [Planctomycetaceae bacterium]